MEHRNRYLTLLDDVRREVEGAVGAAKVRGSPACATAPGAVGLPPTPSDPLAHQARRFLETLDPESAEGLWFEALAQSYPSRLAAAMAYVREVLGRP